MKKYENCNPNVALRRLANAVGQKWYTMLKQDCKGLGRIHDVWNEFYKDMQAIVALEDLIGESIDDYLALGLRDYTVK